MEIPPNVWDRTTDTGACDVFDVFFTMDVYG